MPVAIKGNKLDNGLHVVHERAGSVLLLQPCHWYTVGTNSETQTAIRQPRNTVFAKVKKKTLLK